MDWRETEVRIDVPFGCEEEVRQSPRYAWDNRQRGHEPFVIMQQSLEGEGEFEWQGMAHRVGPGQAFIALVPEASGYRYPAKATQAWRFAWINFYGALARRLMEAFRRRHGPVLALAPRSEAGMAFTRLVKLGAARGRGVDGYEVSARAYAFLMAWWRQLSWPGEVPAGGIDAAVTFCQERYYERINVKELASLAGLTREHFTRAFQARVGTSPGKFLRHRRLEAARAMAESTQLPWGEIALRCGFESAQHLRRAAKNSAMAWAPRPS